MCRSEERRASTEKPESSYCNSDQSGTAKGNNTEGKLDEIYLSGNPVLRGEQL